MSFQRVCFHRGPGFGSQHLRAQVRAGQVLCLLTLPTRIASGIANAAEVWALSYSLSLLSVNRCRCGFAVSALVNG